jgi:methyl-accepting chemotaxis protein
LQMLHESDPAALRELTERGKSLAKDYDDRHQFWTGDLPAGPMKDTLLAASFDPARAFFQIRDQKFVPAVLSGDRTLAENILRNELTPQYQKHRAAIDSVVAMATERGKADEADASATVARGTAEVIGLGLALSLIVIAVGAGIASSLVGRIRRTMAVLEEVAAGNLEQKLDDGGSDEIGRMAVALNAAVAESRRTLLSVQEAAERERGRATSIDQRAASVLAGVAAAQEGDLAASVECEGDDAVARLGAAIGGLLARFREDIAEIAGASHTVATASEELTAVSREMVRQSGDTATAAQRARDLSARITDRIRGVSKSSTEIGANIHSVASSAGEARQVAGEADTLAKNANQRIVELGQASAQIGEVVKVITGIAEQTNLLALNATIEAARAGETGKGFSVVANEVKNLAKDTAEATSDVAEKIAAIRRGVDSAVQAIGAIGVTVNRITHLQGVVAEAVEQQMVVTQTIDKAAVEAAAESSSIATTFDGLASAAHSTTQGAGQIDEAASELAQMAMRLQTLVAKFRLEASTRAPLRGLDGRAARDRLESARGH